MQLKVCQFSMKGAAFDVAVGLESTWQHLPHGQVLFFNLF